MQDLRLAQRKPQLRIRWKVLRQYARSFFRKRLVHIVKRMALLFRGACPYFVRAFKHGARLRCGGSWLIWHIFISWVGLGVQFAASADEVLVRLLPVPIYCFHYLSATSGCAIFGCKLLLANLVRQFKISTQVWRWRKNFGGRSWHCRTELLIRTGVVRTSEFLSKDIRLMGKMRSLREIKVLWVEWVPCKDLSKICFNSVAN